MNEYKITMLGCTAGYINADNAEDAIKKLLNQIRFQVYDEESGKYLDGYYYINEDNQIVKDK